ncbi:hypothetical protein EMPS_10303 [Entomortierella parvispora]|uniref:Uncharacterized protein n=1 Tax=Entomortierella parvispora TaxID=205924 RepID=A0A9P3HJK5_9FUNG|nr:hypothetical protein EMPS_10303 [Entomortierella parvispora]
MKFSIKAIALSALAASVVVAAPIEKRDAAADARIAACFAGLLLTGKWPGSCQAAVAVNMGLIKSIAINQMTMDFTLSNPWAPTTASSNVVATMLSIPGVILPIDTICQHIIIVDNGVQIGNIDTPWSSAKVSGSTLTTSFPAPALNVYSSSHAAFSSFVSALSTTASHPLNLQGTVDVQLDLGIFGRMTIPGIGFAATIPFSGLNNFNKMQYTYQIDSSFDTPGSITLTSAINLNLSLGPGNNYVLSATAQDLSQKATTDFLTQLSTTDTPLYLAGYNATSTNPALNAGLAALKSTLVIPSSAGNLPLSQPPYKNWSLKTLPTTNTDLIVEITATFQSPNWGYPIEMVNAAADGYDNFAQVSIGVDDADALRLFQFQNDLTFTASGTGTATVTFKCAIQPTPFTIGQKPAWQDVVNFANQNKYVTVNFNWIVDVIINTDGVNHYIDWGNVATGQSNVKVAVDSNFASIMNAFPSL